MASATPVMEQQPLCMGNYVWQQLEEFTESHFSHFQPFQAAYLDQYQTQRNGCVANVVNENIWPSGFAPRCHRTEPNICTNFPFMRPQAFGGQQTCSKTMCVVMESNQQASKSLQKVGH